MACNTGDIFQNPKNLDKVEHSARLIKSNDEIINVADCLGDLTDPDSGLSINVSGDLTIAPSETQETLNIQNGKVLFQSDFNKGFDTLNKFHLLYDGTIQLEGSVNASASGAFGLVGPTDFSAESLPCEISYSGADSTNQWLFQSQIPMKPGNNENCKFLFNGRHMPSNVAGVKTINIVARKNGTNHLIVSQAGWNIDKMDGTGPSGLTLDVEKINTLVISVSNKDSGNVRFGIYIGNIVHFVHEIYQQNTLSEQKGSVNRPLRVEGNKVGPATAEYNIGLFDDDAGYFFQTLQVSDGINDAQYEIFSISGFSFGANENNFYRTFSEGNRTNSIAVANTRLPLVSLKPKEFFPPLQRNRTVTALKKINIVGTSKNLNDGIYIEVIFNQGPTILTGATFSLTNENSSVDIDTSATAIDDLAFTPATQIIYAMAFTANDKRQFDISIDADTLFSNFMNQYTCSSLLAIGVAGQKIDPTITVSAKSFSANEVKVSATLVWSEK